MQRVLVLGSGGAGKSTVARRIAERTGLPLVHLDRVYWRPGWVEPSHEEFDSELALLLARDRWIMDGNYGRTMEFRLAAADTAVLVDTPRRTCLARVIRRRLAHIGRTRDDIAPGCPERVTWEFVRWIWTYPSRRRPTVVALLAAFERRGGRAVVLRNEEDLARFLADDGGVRPLR